MILDSNFLIYFERERLRNEDGSATRFCRVNGADSYHITPTIAGEIASGKSMSERRIWDAFLSTFPTLEITREASWQYGELFRFLHSRGNLIGRNDLWIAAVAIAHSEAVVTQNVSEFSRVPGLEVFPFL